MLDVCKQSSWLEAATKMWPNIRVDFLPEWPKISIQQLVVESAVKHCEDMLKRCKTYTLYTWYLPPHYHKNFHWLTIYMILHVHIHWSLTVSWNDMSLKRHNQMHGMHEMHEMQASRTFMASFSDRSLIQRFLGQFVFPSPHHTHRDKQRCFNLRITSTENCQVTRSSASFWVPPEPGSFGRCHMSVWLTPL
jgi:hypothetical protein